MICSIISSEDKQEFSWLKSVTLPAFSGELQILPGHAESFITLRRGEIVLEGNKVNTVPVEDGICYVKDNTLAIIL